MSAGRPPKPTPLKVLEGNRGKRGLNRNEPDPDYLDDLEPSAWLPDAAKVVWRELAFKLRKAKVLTVLDVPSLEKMCVAIATYRRATLAVCGAELIEKNGGAASEKGKSEKASRPIGFVSLGKAGETDAPGLEQPKGEAKAASSAPIGASLNPWVIVQSMAFKQATALLREFGMTPAARSRVMIDPQLGLFGGEQEKSASYFTS